MPDRSHVGRHYHAPGQVVDGAAARAFGAAIAGADEVFDPAAVPPTFAAVYCVFPTLHQLFEDADVGVTLTGLVHAEQFFEWPTPIRGGDVVDATAVITSVEDRRGILLLGVDHEARRQDGDTVCRGHSLMIIR